MTVLQHTKYLPSKIQDQFRLPHWDTVCPTFNTMLNAYIDGSRAVCRIGLNYSTNLSK